MKYSCAVSFFSKPDILKCLYIIPIFFLLFSIYAYFSDLDNEKIIKIRRFYYTGCLFGIVAIINGVDLSKVTISNTFGFPQKILAIFFIFVIGMIISVILYMLIVSNTDIKEITLGWAKISKDEIKNNIQENKEVIDKLTNKIEAEYNTIQNLQIYFNNNNIEDKLKNEGSTFKWGEEFKTIIKYYCNNQNANIDVFVINNSSALKSELQQMFNISSANIELIFKNIKDNKSIPIENNSYLFIPYTLLYTEEEIVIILKGNVESILEIEQRFIINILKLFEDNVTDILIQIGIQSQMIDSV